jgi:DNA topoisomerase VI subunit B
MSNDRSVILEFGGVSEAEGNRYANDLRDFLLDQDPSVKVERRSNRSDTQDFGATLVLVLGTTAANALARGIATWLKRNSGARITIKTPSGELVAENLESKDTPQIAKALSTQNASGHPTGY